MELSELREKLEKLISEAQKAAKSVSPDELIKLRPKFLGRKGELSQIMRLLGQLPQDVRPQAGKLANEAKRKLEDIFDAPIGTPESDEADILGILIDEYEKKHYPIDAPDPIEAIKIRMEEMQLKQVDLVSEIGGKSRVSEILNRKRRLTVDMIRKLANRLNLSAGLLIKDYQLIR